LNILSCTLTTRSNHLVPRNERTLFIDTAELEWRTSLCDDLIDAHMKHRSPDATGRPPKHTLDRLVTCAEGDVGALVSCCSESNKLISKIGDGAAVRSDDAHRVICHRYSIRRFSVEHVTCISEALRSLGWHCLLRVHTYLLPSKGKVFSPNLSSLLWSLGSGRLSFCTAVHQPCCNGVCNTYDRHRHPSSPFTIRTLLFWNVDCDCGGPFSIIMIVQPSHLRSLIG